MAGFHLPITAWFCLPTDNNDLHTGRSRITNLESAAIAETISLRDVRCNQRAPEKLQPQSGVNWRSAPVFPPLPAPAVREPHENDRGTVWRLCRINQAPKSNVVAPGSGVDHRFPSCRIGTRSTIYTGRRQSRPFTSPIGCRLFIASNDVPPHPPYV